MSRVVSRLVRWVSRSVVQVVLVVVGVVWLVPTVGLALASFRTAAADNTTGWWTALSAPGQLTAALNGEPVGTIIYNNGGTQ